MMKGIVTLLLTMILLCSGSEAVKAQQGHLAVTNAEGKQNEIIYLDLVLSDCPKANTVGISMEYDTWVLELEEKSCQWTQKGILKSFDGRKQTGVWASDNMQSLSGKLCTLAFRIKPGAELGDTGVRFEVLLKQDSELVGSFNVESSISIFCAHAFENFERIDANLHEQRCGLCGYKEQVPHNWGKGMVRKPASKKSPGIMGYVCEDCGAEKVEPFTLEEQEAEQKHPDEEQGNFMPEAERLPGIPESGGTRNERPGNGIHKPAGEGQAGSGNAGENVHETGDAATEGLASDNGDAGTEGLASDNEGKEFSTAGNEDEEYLNESRGTESSKEKQVEDNAAAWKAVVGAAFFFIIVLAAFYGIFRKRVNNK